MRIKYYSWVYFTDCAVNEQLYKIYKWQNERKTCCAFLNSIEK